MKYIPTEGRIIIKCEPKEQKTEAGIIITAEKRVVETGEVVAITPEGNFKKGDNVMFDRHQATEIAVNLYSIEELYIVAKVVG